MNDDDRLRGELRLHWSMYFAAIASLQEHPGMNRENAQPKTVAQSAEVADQMLAQMAERMRTGQL